MQGWTKSFQIRHIFASS